MSKCLLLFLSITFVIYNFCYGQYSANQKKIDSLLEHLDVAKIDKNKGLLLQELWRAHIDNDIEKAKFYGREMIKVGGQIENDTILSSGYQRLAIAHAYVQEYEASRVYYLKALKIYEENNAKSPAGMILLNIGLDFNELGVPDSTMYYYDKALSYFEESNDTLGIGDVYRAKSGAFINQGYYRIALENALKANKVFESIGQEFERSLFQGQIALIYEKMNDSLNAEKYLKSSMSYFETADRKRWLSSAKLNLARFYTIQNINSKKVPSLFKEGLQLAEEVNFPFNVNYYHYWYGIYLLNSKKHLESKGHLLKSLQLSDSLGLKADNAMAHVALGNNYLALGKSDSCQYYAELGLQKAIGLGLLEEQKKGYLVLSKNSSKQNNNGQALEYFSLYKQLNDSIYNIENGQRLSELQTIYETEKKEAEIALQQEEIKTLNEKAKVDKLTKGLYAGGMASALALSGLLVFGFRQRIKKNRIEKEKISEELEHKQKELTSQTLHLVQKSQFIAEIKENLENLKNSPEKFKIEFKRIVMLLKKQNAADKDWEVFKSYFSEVHQDFEEKLKAITDKITDKELRLASYVKMGLNNNEIANILNVLPSSIHTSKYRLKQKLNIDKDLDFDGFIKSL